VNTGGRRRPLGLSMRGLSCCALVLTVLSLWLGAAAGRSALGDDHRTLPSVSDVVSMAHVAARPPVPGDAGLPVEIFSLALALSGVALAVRRARIPVRVTAAPSSGRAPPGGARTR
jgi:hypothetical protein